MKCFYIATEKKLKILSDISTTFYDKWFCKRKNLADDPTVSAHNIIKEVINLPVTSFTNCIANKQMPAISKFNGLTVDDNIKKI